MNNRINEGVKSVPSTAGEQKNNFDRAVFTENTALPQTANLPLGNGLSESATAVPGENAPQGGNAFVPLARQKKSFTADAADIIFVIVAFMLGYYFIKKLFIDALLGCTYFNLFVFTVLFSAAGIIYLAVKRRLVCKQGYLYIALGVLSALPSLFYSLYYPFLNTVFAAALCTYGLTSLAGQRLENELGEYFGKDIFNSLVFKPFHNFAAAFSAVFAFCRNRQKGNKNAVFVVVGIAVCFLVGIPVAALLCGADDVFNGWVSNFFSFGFNIDFFSLMLTVPVFLYLYGFLYSCANNRFAQSKSLFIIKQCEEGKTDKPQILFLIPGIFLLCLYALFFAAHIISLGRIAGGTPKIYADFARQGFFQLCCVGAINLLFIIFSRLLCAKKGTPCALRVCSTLMGVFTLVLLVFAALKLGMYMSFCGLTEKRVYAAWAVFVIAVIFAAVIVSQYKKFNCVRFSFFAAVISFIALTLAGTGNITEFYNLNRCLNNAPTEADYVSQYVSSPENAAIALYFAQSVTTDDEKSDAVREYSKTFAEQYALYFDDNDFKNISYSVAKNLCKNKFSRI